MTAKKLFIVEGTMSIVFGFLILLAMEPFFTLFSAEPIDFAGIVRLNTQTFGASLVAMGVGFLLAKDAKSSQGRKAMLGVILVSNLLLTVLYIIAIWNGVVNSLTWLIVLLTSIIAVWSGMLFVKEKV